MWKDMGEEGWVSAERDEWRREGGGGRVSVEEDGFEELSDYGIK